MDSVIHIARERTSIRSTSLNHYNIIYGTNDHATTTTFKNRKKTYKGENNFVVSTVGNNMANTLSCLLFSILNIPLLPKKNHPYYSLIKDTPTGYFPAYSLHS